MKFQIVIISLLVIMNFNCAKIIHKVMADDPCWCAFEERKKIKRSVDDFEKQMHETKAAAYDDLCHKRNTTISNMK